MCTDWKGNEIQEGVEICFIATKRPTFFGMISDGVEDIWEVDSTHTVVRGQTGQLGYWSSDKIDGYTMRFFHLLSFTAIQQYGFVLAIKGVSDMNPNM